MEGREARAAANASCGRSGTPVRHAPRRVPPRERQGFCGVAERHRVGTGERGHRAGHPRHLVQPAGAQASGAQFGGEKVGGVGSQVELASPAR